MGVRVRQIVISIFPRASVNVAVVLRIGPLCGATVTRA
jgi:hypothetical protein